MTHPHPIERSGLHPRNIHRERYDFAALQATAPELSPWIKATPIGEPTIDYADPEAVKALNRALLLHHYGIQLWDIPKGYLCPPVPSRADYIHHVADLLAAANGGLVPLGKNVRVLDIGVGANCVFPIIGRHEYGWRFAGADIDPVSVKAAQAIVKHNPSLNGNVEIRHQASKKDIFRGIWGAEERFDLTICNPPFHSSQADADARTRDKLRNLGQGSRDLKRNFGGQNAELFVEGGEQEFVRRIVEQSRSFSKQCLWFTSVVSRVENVRPIEKAIREAGARMTEILTSVQGQKRSRILCWTYLDEPVRYKWAKENWSPR